jgi:LPXTG-motif cell wall-anchored protein
MRINGEIVMRRCLLRNRRTALSCVVAKFRPVGDDVKYTLFRRATVGVCAAAAAVGLSTLFASPASAHAIKPSGVADCGADGRYTITWTVENDFHTPAHLSDIKVTPGGGNADINLGPREIKKFTTQHAGTTKGDVQLTLRARWKDGDKDWPADGPKEYTSRPVRLEGDCKPSKPPSSAPPSSPSTPRTPTPRASTSAPPGLPVTGSSDTLPMVGTGAALIAGGTVLIVTLRRRRRVTFTAE